MDDFVLWLELTDMWSRILTLESALSDAIKAADRKAFDSGMEQLARCSGDYCRTRTLVSRKAVAGELRPEALSLAPGSIPVSLVRPSNDRPYAGHADRIPGHATLDAKPHCGNCLFHASDDPADDENSPRCQSKASRNFRREMPDTGMCNLWRKGEDHTRVTELSCREGYHNCMANVQRAACPKCGRDVMIVKGPDGPVYRQHVREKGRPCPASGRTCAEVEYVH